MELIKVLLKNSKDETFKKEILPLLKWYREKVNLCSLPFSIEENYSFFCKEEENV